MSKKRTPSASEGDQRKKGGANLFPEDEEVKRPKIETLSDTTLEDLPFELIESILMKVIIMEVKGMKLANSVWKEKADQVISRLRTVCSHWSNILTTNFFRNELHRTLESAQETIRLEILSSSQHSLSYSRVTLVNEEVYILDAHALPDEVHIDVYDRNNMAVVKEVIPLPQKHPQELVVNSVAKCLYLLNKENALHQFSVLCIARDDDNRFTVEPFVKEIFLPQADICVSNNGNLILTRKQTKNKDALTVFDVRGEVMHTIRIPIELESFDSITSNSNGNLIFVQINGHRMTKLTEFSLNGMVVRQYLSSVGCFAHICSADRDGRMLVSGHDNKMELIDSEFNLMESFDPILVTGQFDFVFKLLFCGERNEILAIVMDQNNFQNRLFTFIRLE